MTVATQMTQAIATVQNAAASMKTFALETEDETAKQTFQQLARTFDDALISLQDRQRYLEGQEVQFRQ